MVDNDIQELELSIEQAREVVERGRKVRTLIANPIFKEIIDDGYLLKEAARLAHMSSDPGLAPQVREAILRDLTGPGSLKRFLLTIMQQADMAQYAIEQSQEEIENILAEDNPPPDGVEDEVLN